MTKVLCETRARKWLLVPMCRVSEVGGAITEKVLLRDVVAVISAEILATSVNKIQNGAEAAVFENSSDLK